MARHAAKGEPQLALDVHFLARTTLITHGKMNSSAELGLPFKKIYMHTKIKYKIIYCCYKNKMSVLKK